nr:MAG TPA: hypothetical protein [Caudoviricetes sp.]DAM45986.1 MAG TPA: hypothetical protein [Caudoviricetes sp.]
MADLSTPSASASFVWFTPRNAIATRMFRVTTSCRLSRCSSPVATGIAIVCVINRSLAQLNFVG